MGLDILPQRLSYTLCFCLFLFMTLGHEDLDRTDTLFFLDLHGFASLTVLKLQHHFDRFFTHRLATRNPD